MVLVSKATAASTGVGTRTAGNHGRVDAVGPAICLEHAKAAAMSTGVETHAPGCLGCAETSSS